MFDYQINKNICLLDGTKIFIDLSIPLECKVTDESEDEVIEGTIISQLLNGFKEGKKAYENSALPDKYLSRSKFIITNKLEYGVGGVFRLKTDEILFDANGMSGITETPSYLFGHELGHKIAKYIDKLKALEEIANILMLSTAYKEYLNEIFANECGVIVSGIENDAYYDIPLSQGKREGIHQIILANSYRV